MARHRKGAAPKADPIFALIAAHARAVKTSDRATASLYRLRERLDARKDQRQVHAERRLTCVVPLFDIGGKFDPVAVIRKRDEIKNHVFRTFDTAREKLGPRARSRIMQQEREAIREIERRYDAFQRAHRARRRACGLVAKERAVEIATAASFAAATALTKTAPTTPQGAQGACGAPVEPRRCACEFMAPARGPGAIGRLTTRANDARAPPSNRRGDRRYISLGLILRK